MYQKPSLFDSITLRPAEQQLLDGFAAWMKNERGLADCTIRQQHWFTLVFYRWCKTHHRSLSTARISDVDLFLAERGMQCWSRTTVASAADALRNVFRHARMCRWPCHIVPEAIEGPKIFSHENLPRGPRWEDVQRLLRATKTGRPDDIRDYAILLLLAVYGLRASEVARLRLEDIDWDNDRISIFRLKRSQPQTYPLAPTVGNAIARYLQKVRPQSFCREVFLTLRRPFRPINRVPIYDMTCTRMTRLGIQSPHMGPHALRHACATHLLAEGLTFKEIGDHLGHRSTEATFVYAKVDMAALREVAALDCGGLI